MKNKHLKITYCLFAIFLQAITYGQEIITSLDINPVIENYHKNQKHLKSIANEQDTILDLPFVDDFAKPGIYPDPVWWDNSEVYVNYTYGIDPPSIGVATFDCYDYTGKIHNIKDNNSFVADSLVSKQINLDYPGDNSIFLSFYYQKGGRGNLPEEEDSLVVEFYSPKDTAWHSVHSIKGGGQNNVFEQVVIPINEEKYLDTGFRFKIKNYASFNDPFYLQFRERDVDHWHLDYVYLDRGRSINDTLIDDVAVSKNQKPMLKNFTSMPIRHFSDRVNQEEVLKTFELTYRNNSGQPVNVQQGFKISDVSGITTPFQAGRGTKNILPQQEITKPTSIDYEFNMSGFDDVAVFEVTGYINIDSLMDVKRKYLRWNDTSRFYHTFSNYYAYDDGSPENGFGLTGEGTSNSLFAIQYYTYKPDTIGGAYINFLNYNTTENLYFNLTLWDDNNGEPGKIIYSQPGFEPTFGESYTDFTYYPFDTTIIVQDTFYIGMIQIYEGLLNIGFDMNANNQHRNFKYVINPQGVGVWTNFNSQGTLMIRPYFGKINEPTTIGHNMDENFDFNVFPNPVNGILYFGQYDNPGSNNLSVKIVDITGKQIMEFQGIPPQVDFSYCPPGIYIIQVTDNMKFNVHKKVSVIR